jgi:hypothetical protein
MWVLFFNPQWHDAIAQRVSIAPPAMYNYNLVRDFVTLEPGFLRKAFHV